MSTPPINYADCQKHSQITLNGLIHYLQQQRNRHGNIPIVFWAKSGQELDPTNISGISTPYHLCPYGKLENFISVDNGVLWIGGFDELGKDVINIQM